MLFQAWIAAWAPEPLRREFPAEGAAWAVCLVEAVGGLPAQPRSTKRTRVNSEEYDVVIHLFHVRCR